ncbi:MAG: hypothetical protein KU38_11230 [Sulfurovum sp. FS08-3]|nr:MAG: hypothetical protein KU38_11230 [Sulfurovum sp. FS08-3]
MKKCGEHSEVSAQTPLLSNLSICENIALIREYHHRLSPQEAFYQAQEALRKIEMESICANRIHQCQSFEIFYAMVIRAMMSDRSKIVIVTPYGFVKKLSDFNRVLDTLQKLELPQEVVVIDVYKNLHHYRDCPCNILK